MEPLEATREPHSPAAETRGVAPALLAGLAGLLLGAGLGAGLMFLLDPDSGRRRRAVLRDRARGLRARGGVEVGQRARGLSQRSRGLAAALRARFGSGDVAEANTLEARVRARLGRVASNPSAIAVAAEGSRITLRGSVPPHELDDVLDEVSAVHGVREVYNLLQVQLGGPRDPGQH